MKKFLFFLAMAAVYCNAALAETIVVIDGEGRVVRQMFTTPSTYNAPVVTTTTTTAQPVVQTVPGVTVVRESPVVNNSYYYDRSSTNAALAAGVTTAIVGGLLYEGFHPHRRHRGWRFPRPHHGRRHRW